MNKETRNKYSNFIFVHYSKGRKALWNHFHPTEIRRLSPHPTKVASQVALEDKEKPNFGVSKSCIVKSAPSRPIFTPYCVCTFVRLFLSVLARFPV